MDVQLLKKKYHISFTNDQLLKQAFTHSSYANEHHQRSIVDNERLEFLGDAVLELGISQYIYKMYTNMSEGEMTKLRSALVCESSLANFAKDLKFEDFILLGKGEEQTGGRHRPSLLADVFEAFLGALYLDQGYEEVLKFLKQYIFPKISTDTFSHAVDYKSKLQEMIQQSKNYTITYNIIQEYGPAHNKEFVAKVDIDHLLSKIGIGRTKKEAEQQAAKYALDALGTLNLFQS